MTIGEKIKYLRKKNDISQEKLAEYLNITYQSISKWENNNALPDISLAVPLANFFGVTLDELFDRNGDAEAANVKEYMERDRILGNRGDIAGKISLWREAVQKYPRNYDCLIRLAFALHDTLYRCEDFTHETRDAYVEEAVSICERIIRDCKDIDTRESALQILVYTYANSQYPNADETKAEKYAKMAGSMWTSREILLEGAYYTDEGNKKQLKVRQQNAISFMDCICMCISLNSYESPKEQITACETALKLWNTFIDDGNFLFYHCRMAQIYYYLAKAHAELEHKNETFQNLRKALYHAKAFDSIPDGVHNYTSTFISSAVYDTAKFSKNFKETETELIRGYLNNTVFDLIRDDAEFAELLKEADSL